MSSAKLWYKCDDASSPLVNSGSGGVRNLVYNVATSDGEGNYRVAGQFGPCLEIASPHLSTKYLDQVDDTAWFGANVTLWCWFMPYVYPTGQENFLWGRYTWFGGTGFGLQIGDNNSLIVIYEGSFGQGSLHTNNNVFTINQPHLFAVTYDGSVLTVYVDGASVGQKSLVGTMTTLATDSWQLGCQLGQGGWVAWGKYLEVGFDNTTFSAVKLLSMYNAGIV